MLGNFSFGDYFKRDAIHWAWEFLTDKKWLGLDPERLSVTVYLDDDEAAGIWAERHQAAARPDRAAGRGRELLAGQRPEPGARRRLRPVQRNLLPSRRRQAVEIWNLVFTQFNRVGDPPNNLRPLPSKNIDTGMGLERTAAVLQGVDTNFHIDILRPLVEAAAEVCGVKYESESRQRPPAAADRRPRPRLHVRRPRERLSRPEQGEVRRQAAAAPRRARRPPDGRARAVPAQARADGGRDDEAAVSRA